MRRNIFKKRLCYLRIVYYVNNYVNTSRPQGQIFVCLFVFYVRAHGVFISKRQRGAVLILCRLVWNQQCFRSKWFLGPVLSQVTDSFWIIKRAREKACTGVLLKKWTDSVNVRKFLHSCAEMRGPDVLVVARATSCVTYCSVRLWIQVRVFIKYK